MSFFFLEVEITVKVYIKCLKDLHIKVEFYHLLCICNTTKKIYHTYFEARDTSFAFQPLIAEPLFSFWSSIKVNLYSSVLICIENLEVSKIFSI